MKLAHYRTFDQMAAWAKAVVGEAEAVEGKRRRMQDGRLRGDQDGRNQ